MPSQAPGYRGTIGRNIRALRLSHGLTQRGLAEQLDVGEMLVSKWERGKHRPSDENLAALSGVFGCTLGSFYTEVAA